MLNRVILMGRLTSAPELKTTPQGVSVTSFSLAVDRNYVKQGEERKADFFNIVAWRNQADFICRYFGKGSMIAIEGQLQSRSYQTKEGTNRYVVEVVVDNVSFTGEKSQEKQQAEPYHQQATAPQPAQQYQQPPYQQNTAPQFQQQQGYQQQMNGYTSQPYSASYDDDLPF